MPAESSDAKSKSTTRRDFAAPPWHTIVLVAWIVAVNAVGVVLAHGHFAIVTPPSSSSKILAAYVPAIAAQWMLFAYVVFAPRPRGVLTHLMGRDWKARGRAPIDAACALALILFIFAFELISARLFDVQQNPAIVTLLPRTIGERLAWIFVAVSAGFCEEVVYRGYLREQLSCLVRSAWVGVALQALLFGIAHAEQGVSAVFRFAVYGVAFGIVTRERASLVPCILAHVSIDLGAGLLPH